MCCISFAWFPLRHLVYCHTGDATWLGMRTEPLRWVEKELMEVEVGYAGQGSCRPKGDEE